MAINISTAFRQIVVEQQNTSWYIAREAFIIYMFFSFTFTFYMRCLNAIKAVALRSL